MVNGLAARGVRGGVVLGVAALLACAGSSGGPVVAPPAPLPERSAAPVAVASSSAPAEAPVAAASGSAAGWAPFEDTVAKTLFEATLARWSATSRCADYDYFPGGGMRSFWCHRPEDLDLEGLRAMAGVDIFVAGPHRKGMLAAGDPHDFGRYNPAFVRWLVDKGAPQGRDSAARKATQALYEANLRPLAEIFWKVHEKLVADDACFQRERSRYEALVRNKTLPNGYYERWFFFMSPYYCSTPVASASWDNQFFYDNGFDAGSNGNVAKSVVGFWLRRSIDGTRDTFVEGLKKLLAAYQPGLMIAPTRFPDPAALTRGIDEALAAARVCPQTPADAARRFTLFVQTNGKLRLAPNQPTPALNACITQAWSKIQLPAFDGSDLPFNRSLGAPPPPRPKR